jgi:hypothetical protein
MILWWNATKVSSNSRTNFVNLTIATITEMIKVDPIPLRVDDDWKQAKALLTY